MDLPLTLADVLTVSGAVGSAALITGLIALAKNIRGIGPLIDRGNEPTVAFALSALLVIAAFAARGTYTPDGAFAAFLAWYGIATIAMGIHDQQAKLTAGPPPATSTFTAGGSA